MKHTLARLLSVLFGVLSFAMMNVSASTTWNVCQSCGTLPFRQTIAEVMQLAEDGDTIEIWGEEDPNATGYIYEYNERVVVNKRVTITCSNPEPDLGYPVISGDFATHNEVIWVTHDNVEISFLNVEGPSLTNISHTYPMDNWDNKVGVRIEAGNCTVDNCKVTHCMTGIVIDSTFGPPRTGNVVENSIIGNRIYNGSEYNEFWCSGTLPAHPGNGFGIVVKGPTWLTPTPSYINYSPNEIVDCTIRSNRYYGVILTNGSRARVAHNIIAWNGDLTASMASQTSDVNPDKTGGLLSLFTANQISSNTNQLQSPMILSNSIYGNLGYQVSVITGSTSPKTVYNSPVLMSNTIGTQADMGDPSGTNEINMENYLISCGPIPAITPTLTPTPTTTPNNYPTRTPAPPGEYPYNYHGSGPVMAWNCLSVPEGYEHYYAYHPMQKDTLAHTPTPRPPTFTPGGPTATPTPIPTNTPYHTWTPGPSPTGIPSWTPTPTPNPLVPTSTPRHYAYQFGRDGWDLKNVKGDAKVVGWYYDQGVPLFDWHVSDLTTANPTQPPAGTPTQPPPLSDCINTGGLLLNPGVSQADMLPDEGRIDIGYHSKGGVPSVLNISTDWVNRDRELLIEWDQPDYYYSGEIMHYSDVGGYKFYLGLRIPGTLDIIVLGSPENLSADITEKRMSRGAIPGNAQYVGVSIYDVRGFESDIKWKLIPSI